MSNRPLVRLGAISAWSLLALALSSCGSSSGLPLTVTSVTGTWQAAPPGPAFGGIPSERVDFTLGDYTYGSTAVVCLVNVRHEGQLVGTDHVTIGSEAGTAAPRGVQESDVVGDQFALTLQWRSV